MSGSQVRCVRERLGLTQKQAAQQWGLSQTYVSLVESDKRPVPGRLAHLLAKSDPEMAAGLPVETADVASDDLPAVLGALQYPGFAYLGDSAEVMNPAVVVLTALRSRVVPMRVTEAVPWVLATFPDLKWDWLVDQAKLANVQNRLGFVVGLAKEMAQKVGATETVQRLSEPEQRLEEARLANEDSLGRELTDVERRYFREVRSEMAVHWNLLTGLRAEDLQYGL